MVVFVYLFVCVFVYDVGGVFKWVEKVFVCFYYFFCFFGLFFVLGDVGYDGSFVNVDVGRVRECDWVGVFVVFVCMGVVVDVFKFVNYVDGFCLVLNFFCLVIVCFVFGGVG